MPLSKRQIQDRMDAEWAKLRSLRAMLKGTVSQVNLGARRRGSGQRIAYLLTYKAKGNKTQSLYVAKTRLHEVRRMIARYRKAKVVLETLVALNVTLFRMK